MNDGLLDPFRHNAWATKELLATCRSLGPGQLEATAAGTYGSILATMQHILGADSRYLFRLTGQQLPWERPPEETIDLAELEKQADDLAAGWEDLLAGPVDPERVITARSSQGFDFEVKAGILVAQALNHGNEHRSQVFTILTTIGVQPPDLDGWSYGAATGRFTQTSG